MDSSTVRHGRAEERDDQSRGNLHRHRDRQHDQGGGLNGEDQIDFQGAYTMFIACPMTSELNIPRHTLCNSV